jgi:membrane-associated phospholipid phosphatase
MDLIRALIVSEAMVETLKYTTRRERPDGSGKNSFPSGHAADTFAFATALERHLNWKMVVPAYIFSSYVAMSRLPANRHWMSDVVFGSAVGIISGRTVTGHELNKYHVQLVPVPGGLVVSYAHHAE